MPRDKDGNFFTTRIEDDDEERLQERALNAVRFGGYGARIGGPLGPAGTIAGATLGAISGFILGDQETTTPGASVRNVGSLFVLDCASLSYRGIYS